MSNIFQSLRKIIRAKNSASIQVNGTLPLHNEGWQLDSPVSYPAEETWLQKLQIKPEILLKTVEVDGREYPLAVTFQPHSDDGGDAYYIGDIYETVQCEHGPDGWASSLENKPYPYLEYVKTLSKSLPHLEYLAHWMQATAAPPKWKFMTHFRDHVSERARRTNICILDYDQSGKVTQHPISRSCHEVEKILNNSPQTNDTAHTRLIIVEDLSRDVVELLGTRFDVDPLFFLSHIGDYLFHNTRDRWVELPDLDIIAREQCHLQMQYLRARYFKTPEAFNEADKACGLFNVLRRLDSDRSSKRLQNGLLDVRDASVTLTRAKTSLWWKPRDATIKPGEPVLAILLVDPTVRQGHTLWGGHRPFAQTPSMKDVTGDIAQQDPTETTLFESVIQWSSQMTAEDLQAVQLDSRCLGLPMFRIVLAEWRIVLKYMTTMLGKIEWEFEDPHWGERPSDVDKSLRKLSPWRRNVPYYQQSISAAMDRLFTPSDRSELRMRNVSTPVLKSGIFPLLYDFRLVQQGMDACQQRIERIQQVATNSINIEESRRAAQQNKNLARLTFLATIFIPLSFTTSFLSMSSNIAQATQTIWLFFVIGIPLTVLALLVVDLSNPQDGYIMGKWRKMRDPKTVPSREKLKSKPPTASKPGETINWRQTLSERQQSNNWVKR